MDYIRAVALAKEGKEEGYQFLYEQTYKSKYYLALKYMQNEESAKDVLQDAYIKAFTKLDTLDKPETFASWLGVIVANTAKNALVRKNPILFTDIAVDDQDESFEYEIEDDNVENQPELSYTRKETQELVHELLDELPEEQKLCLLMFHIEGASLAEISEALNCNVNTVKSRLNYGRKSLKAKAEELVKKGYKLYGVSPIPLLVHLMMAESEGLSASSEVERTGGLLGKRILEAILDAKDSNTAAVVANTGIQTAASGLAQQTVEKGTEHMLKNLIGKWIGTYAAKSVAFKAATAVTTVALVATPVAVNYVNSSAEQANQPAAATEGGVEGTKNMDDLLDENGNLKGFVDVSGWTQEDLDKANEEKKAAAKEKEKEMLENAEDNWKEGDPLPWDNGADAESGAKTDDTTASAQTPSAGTSDTSNNSNKDSASEAQSEQSKSDTSKENTKNNDNNYATPGSTGPNGETVGNIKDMPGYNGDDLTEEEKKQREQAIIDSNPNNWKEGDPLPWETEETTDNTTSTDDTTATPSETTDNTTSADDTTATPSETTDNTTSTDDTTVTGTDSSSSSSSSNGLLGSTSKAFEEAFKQAQEQLNAQSSDTTDAETTTE